MARTKLNKRFIDRLVYDKKGNAAKIVFDSEITGFGIRVYPSGRKSFLLRYSDKNGRRSTEKLGDYGELTVKQARDKALALRYRVRTGIHEPALAHKNQSLLLKEFSGSYLEDHAKPQKKSWRDDQYRLEKHVVPFLGNIPLASVRRSDVSELHRKIGRDSIYEANRVLALIRVMFSKAIEWGVLPENHINPAIRIQKFKETKRDRFVTREEMPKLLKAINAVSDPFARTALWLYLLTGLRKNELLTARWENIDLERGLLFLPDTKANRPHTIPLSSHAIELLKELPRQKDNPYVFPGRSQRKSAKTKKGKAHLTSFRRTWESVRRAANLQDVRLHDLRRTVGSWLALDGESLLLIGKVLNHSNPSTTKVYARLADDSTRGALENHSLKLLEAAGQPRTVASDVEE